MAQNYQLGLLGQIYTVSISSNSATVNSSFTAVGNSTFSNTITVTGNATFSNTMSVTGSTTFSNNMSVTGNVGIGTSSSGSYKLDVVGKTTLRGVSGAISDGGLQLRTSDTNTNNSRLNIGVTNSVSAFITGGTTINPPFVWYTNDGTTEQMRIDSSGNLLIGTAKPGSVGNAFLFAYQGAVAVGNSTAAPFFQTYHAAAGTDLKTWRFGPQSNDGSIQLQTVNDAYNAATTRMGVDSSGRITMPYQPAFWAYGSGTQSWSGAGVYTKVDFTGGGQLATANKSGGWSQTNSRYTAPVAGTYEFVLSFACSTATSTGPAAYLYKNGSAVFEVCISYYTTSYSQCTGNIFVELAANDYVEFYIANLNGTTFSIDKSRTHFSGRLIG